MACSGRLGCVVRSVRAGISSNLSQPVLASLEHTHIACIMLLVASAQRAAACVQKTLCKPRSDELTGDLGGRLAVSKIVRLAYQPPKIQKT